MSEEVLAVFAREPVPGRVKTRLARSLGDEAACTIYRHLLSYTLRVLSASGRRVMLWLTPESKSQFLQDPLFQGHFEIYRQQGVDLGDRMNFLFKSTLAAGYGRVVLVGSDCPGLTPAHIDAAFDTLLSRDVVLGPSEDGGYWLMGQSSPFHDLFSGMTWSHGDVYRDTCDKIASLGLSSGAVGTLRDIDQLEDLKKFSADYRGEDPSLLEIQWLLNQPHP